MVNILIQDERCYQECHGTRGHINTNFGYKIKRQEIPSRGERWGTPWISLPQQLLCTFKTFLPAHTETSLFHLTLAFPVLMLSCFWFLRSHNCSLPGPSVHGILQARIVEWVAIPFSRESSQPRDWTCISHVSCIEGGFFTCRAITEAPAYPVLLG